MQHVKLSTPHKQVTTLIDNCLLQDWDDDGTKLVEEHVLMHAVGHCDILQLFEKLQTHTGGHGLLLEESLDHAMHVLNSVGQNHKRFQSVILRMMMVVMLLMMWSVSVRL
jgi:hypothetical protein